MKHNPESGNVLFYILIAVALLAALTFAVAQSGRGSVKQVNEERARIIATEIIEYANIVSAAVSQLRLRGCTDEQISFENDIVSGYTNPNAPTDEFCHVFSINGGGVNYTPPPEGIFDTASAASASNATVGGYIGEWYFPGAICVNLIGSGDDTCFNDTGTADLIIMLPWLQDTVCEQISELQGELKSDGSLPTTGGTMVQGQKFVGTYPDGTPHISADLTGKSSACFFKNDQSGHPGEGNFFYKVLIAR